MDNTCRIDQSNHRPGLWEKHAQGQGLVVEQRHENQGPAPAKGTDKAQARGAPLAALHAKGRRHVQQRTVRDLGVGHAPHAQQPQRGDRDGQPQAGRPLRLGHPRALPLPACPLGHLEALLDPGPQPIPTGITGRWRQIGQDQPAERGESVSEPAMPMALLCLLT